MLSFDDYKRARAEARKIRRPFLTNNGKNIPTPHQVVSKLASKTTKNDYAIQSFAGSVIRIMFSDQADADAFAKSFVVSPFKRGDGRPCTVVAGGVVDGRDQTALAKRLGLV
jgi:hypothetical protein